MTDGELTHEQKTQVAEIIRGDLVGRFGDKLKFDPITVTTRTNEYGEQYCHIRVAYSGDESQLDPSWLNGFYRRNSVALRGCGITGVTTETYVDRTEDSDWSELGRVAPSVE